ncbi:uncharacterized protein LOC116771780 isoform X2 [Danaus plexippus]|uniref:uncharacterized protein LOC116771780 isoform X2 n=1 Tax=Danaus plexippus TaxID=13037 RepID=UPI002AB0E67B|nr:uncharacterized protein LOC116771780 isoform X2 [Danaus plexippus]
MTPRDDGMNIQSEVCLWTLLGLVRTIFDATLFKVNANLKQVWQMTMPLELSLPVQRVLRTMISGVMLVQCFTVYVYLASYIVLLYPVFLEERPTLVLPWLLLAAIRNFLCELTSLALGLGTCVLLGPARPPCIKFVITKLGSIMPSFYMWMLIFSYYHNLKLATAFKTFAVSTSSNLDYGLELAVRRRRTKSLQDEDQLRKKLIASLYHDNMETNNKVVSSLQTVEESTLEVEQNFMNSNNDEAKSSSDVAQPYSVMATRTMSDIGTFEDWFGSEVVLPRDADRILEQFVLMLMRIGAYLKKSDADLKKFLSVNSQVFSSPKGNKQECQAMPTEETDTPPIVGTSKGRTQSYLLDYPDIFMRKPSDILGAHSINEKLRETKHFDDNSYKSASFASITGTSLDRVSDSSKFRDYLEKKKNLIHSEPEVSMTIPKSTEKHIEHLETSSSILGNEPSSLKETSSDCMREILNNLEDRTALALEQKSKEYYKKDSGT